MARRLIDKIIYSITEKPKHYVEVKILQKLQKKNSRDRRMHGRCSIIVGARVIKYIAVHISRIKEKNLKSVDGALNAEAITYTKPNIYAKAPDSIFLDTVSI